MCAITEVVKPANCLARAHTRAGTHTHTHTGERACAPLAHGERIWFPSQPPSSAFGTEGSPPALLKPAMQGSGIRWSSDPQANARIWGTIWLQISPSEYHPPPQPLLPSHFCGSISARATHPTVLELTSAIRMVPFTQRSHTSPLLSGCHVALPCLNPSSALTRRLQAT